LFANRSSSGIRFRDNVDTAPFSENAFLLAQLAASTDKVLRDCLKWPAAVIARGRGSAEEPVGVNLGIGLMLIATHLRF
jgi:hypothetical protein